MSDQFFPNRPQAQQRFNKKYASGAALLPFISSLKPQTKAALKDLDETRANNGQNPLTNAETVRAATAADQERKVTPEPDSPIWVDAARDVQNIVSEVPKLPVSLAREVMQIPNLGSAITELPESSTPFETVGNLAKLPGLRLIPGSFVASQFATGGEGVGGLTEHPVMTALDVLPYLSKAAKLTPTVKAAEELAQAESAATLRPPNPVRPIPTLIKNLRKGGPVTEMVDQFGTQVERLEPNVVGKAGEVTKTALKRTAPGRVASQAWSSGSRELARVANRLSAEIPGGGFDPDNPMVVTAREVGDEAAKIGDEYKDVPLERQTELTIASETGAPDWRDRFNDRELELHDRLQSQNDRLRDAYIENQAGLQRVEYPHGPEVFDDATANRILKARTLTDRQSAVAHLRDVLDPDTPTTATADQLLTDLHTVLEDTTMTGAQRKRVARGYARELSNQGHDLDTFVKDLDRAKTIDLPALRARLSPDAVDVRPPTDIVRPHIEGLRRLARTDGTARELIHNLDDGNWKAAQRGVRTLKARSKFTPDVDLDNLELWVKNRRQSQAAIGKLEQEGFTDAALTKAERRRTLTESRAVPARWKNAVNDQLDTRARDYIERTYAGEDLDRALASLDTGAADQFIPDLKELKLEVRTSWQDLKEQGYDPVFVHHVTPQRAARAQFPQVMDFTPSLSQMKARLWDSGPYVQNGAVALHAGALEYLIQQGSKEFANVISQQWAKPLTELRETVLPEARAAFEKNPNVSLQTHMSNLIDRDWKPFDPEAYVNGSKPKAGANPDTQQMIPRDVAGNLDRLKPQPDQIGKLIDPVMKVFRTSVLPLSPRWHVGNVLSGMVMDLARAKNPVTFLKYARDARQMMKDGGLEGLADDLTGAEREAARFAPGGGNQRQHAEWMRDVDLSTPAKKLAAVNNIAAGRTLRRLWDSAASEKVRSGFNTAVQKSYDANQYVDDFYRSMAYLEGKDKALIKGLSREEQIAAGIGQARQTLSNWDTMTPMERSVLRYVFPFYSWARTVMRYTMTYPADHPWRMSILANFANAELEDGNSGLPQKLRGLLFLGDPDSEGNTTAINLDMANPFKDVSNYFTLAGFAAGDGDLSAVTGQLNPLLSTALQFGGVDAMTGQSEMFPELEYDPTTGGLKVAQEQNPLLQGLGNIVPQTKLIGMLTQSSQEYRDLARKNPNAAAAMLRSGLGLPALTKAVNVPQEVAKAELSRYESMRTDLSDSLKAGDIEGFEGRYPGLGSIKEKLARLSPQQRAQFQVDPTQAGGQQRSTAELLKRALGVPVG